MSYPDFFQLHYLLTPVQAAKVRIEERETRDGRDRELQGVRGDEMSIAFAFGNILHGRITCTLWDGLKGPLYVNGMHWADAFNKSPHEIALLPYTNDPSC